jgi:crossover junction endodeoxyribonuclease RuvC
MPFLEPSAAARRILGVDPGLAITGYAVIESAPDGPQVCEAGVIRGEGKTMGHKVLCVYSGIAEIVEQFSPQVMVELYAHYAHPRTAILMGHARGAILLAAQQKGLEIVSYNATRIKKTITGSGRASKDQMQRTIQRELTLAAIPEPPDVADALAAALCHYYVQKISVE